MPVRQAQHRAVAEDVFVWIEKFAQARMGILLIDHNVRRVVRMSDRICVRSPGKITGRHARGIRG